MGGLYLTDIIDALVTISPNPWNCSEMTAGRGQVGVGVGRFGGPRITPEPGIEPASFPNFRDAGKEARRREKTDGGKCC